MFVLNLIVEHPWVTLAIFLAAIVVVQSLHRIGPTEVGLVTKRFGWKKLAKGSPVAFDGEAGYQADLLMAGLPGKRGCSSRSKSILGSRSQPARSAW